MRGSGKKRPALNVGDRVISKRKSWRSKRQVWIVSHCIRDSICGRDPVQLIYFLSGRKYTHWSTRRDLYRLDLPPVDMSVYKKGSQAGAALGHKPTQKVSLKPGVIERRDHPVYIGQLAKATFLADLARDMTASAQRTLRSFPPCRCCGEAMKIVVKHHSSHSESRFACAK